MINKFMFEVPRIKEEQVNLLLEIIRLKCVDDKDYKIDYDSYRTGNITVFSIIYEIQKKDKITEVE